MRLNILEISSQKTEKATSVGSTYHETHGYLVKEVDKICPKIPSEGSCVDLMAIKSFNAYSLILWLLSKTDYIRHLYISTYSMNLQVCDALHNLHNEGKVKEMDVVVSDSLRQRNPRVSDALLAMQDGNIRVKFAWNHTKIALAETKEKDFVSITGSANFSRNAQYENYIIRNDQRVYDFYTQWFNQIEEK